MLSKVREFINQNYISIKEYFNDKTLKYKRDNLSVLVTISANKTLLNYIESNNITNEIVKYLKVNFCGDFYCDTLLNNEDFDESVLEERAIQMQKNIKTEQAAPRYKVTEPMIVFGSEIMPLPEYMKNLKGEKLSMILAGEVSDLVEKEYLPKERDQASRSG